jgi:LytS/YehU family sensor histidine kinase
LNSISALTLKNPDLARDMIVKLSDFFRYSLGKSDKELTSLKSELNNIELYLDIEKIRFQKRLNYTKKIKINCKELLIPNMILQPLLENAVKHGVYESTETITISLSCENENDNLVIVLTNGKDPESVSKKGKGLGLKNIKKRLFLIYGRDDLIKIISKPDSFKVSLIVPQIKERID